MNGNVEFSINGLQPNSLYTLKIYAKNSKGISRHMQLKAETLRPAERLIDGNFNLDSVFASDSISGGNEGYGQLSSNSDDNNALTNEASSNLDLTSADSNSNVLNSELLAARNTRSMFGFTSGKPMLLVLLSGIVLVSLIIVALGVAVILRVKRVHGGRMNSNQSSSNGSSLGGRTSNSNSQSINETSTNTVNTSCSTGELLTNKIVSSKSQNSSPANHHQYQLSNSLMHSAALNATLGRQSQMLAKRQSIANGNNLLIHGSPQKLIAQSNGTPNQMHHPNASTGILTTALPGITDDCCCEEDYCEELRMVSSVISEQQQQQRALIAQHQLDQQQLYQSLINSGKAPAPTLIPAYGTGFGNYENTGKQFIAYGEFFGFDFLISLSFSI